MDEDKFKEAMTKLSAGGLNVTSYSDTRITGTITADKSGLMFTSIPYDKSWTVYVDGTPVSTQKLVMHSWLLNYLPEHIPSK